jgi:hypothetical protein
MVTNHVAAVSASILMLIGFTPIAASQTASTNDESRAGVQRTTDDVHVAGRIVHVENQVNGDVAAVGAEVTLDGPVNGYVMSAGRAVTIEGRVGNDVWAAGETVTVDNTIGNNAMLAGRDVSIGPKAVIGHDARLAGNTVTAQGRVERNLRIGAETARIGGEIGGTVNARAENVSILPGALIRGDLFVRANRPPDISPQAQVLGQVHYEDITATQWAAWPTKWLFSFIALLILGLAALIFAPAWPARVAGTMRVRTWASILSGIFVLLVIPIVAAALAVTLVGLPLALVLFAFYVAMLLLAGVFVSYRTGDWLLMHLLHRMPSSVWIRMILGVLIISIGMTLPAIGLAVTAIVLIFGAGALVLERRSDRVHAHSMV